MELDFELICVQKHPEFIDECIELLNSEWPRSKTARMVAIQQGSAEAFPTALLLITEKRQVVAHCKVSPVSVYQPDTCFVESVVVAKHLRGKGIGRIIMKKMEDYVKCRGISTIYLTTHDKQSFYEKVGYTVCDPIVIYGGKFQSLQKQNDCHSHPATPSDLISKLANLTFNKECKTDGTNESKKNTPTNEPPPPPPPPITKSSKISKDSIIILRNQNVKVTMKKVL